MQDQLYPRSYSRYLTPLGVTQKEKATHFALFSKHATKVILSLYPLFKEEPFQEVALKKEGEIWHISIEDLPESFDYTYRCEGPYAPQQGHLYNRERELVDPYAKDLNASTIWNGGTPFPRGRFKKDPPFNWGHDARPMIPMEKTIIYEMHVRSMTKHPSSHVNNPGTFVGVIEKIPYLKKLGINAVELLPIYEFNEDDHCKNNLETGQPLFNYWGYSTTNFFTPMKRFGTKEELKELVKTLHENGIEIILDVTYNHTAHAHSFRGIDNAIYYMVDENGDHNYAGCGNTLNCNHPAVQGLILHSLRHWVLEYHVDGFRFDLASILTRGEQGEILTHPPLIEKITKDPLLGPVKLIAEPWDCAGLYQVGCFPSWRFSEWNDKYRDAVRHFLQGKGGKEEVKQRILGSPDLYQKQGGTKSINFVTAHDGFTLKDLVSYERKQNRANREDNRDGASENMSWNCGVEGETNDPEILQLRNQQMRNMLLMLLTSQGTPMLLMGDEYGHTRRGNNNAWCQDNELNYFLWDELEKNQALFTFVSRLIHFRKNHFLSSCLSTCLSSSKITWDDHPANSFLAYTIQDEILIAFNASSKKLKWTEKFKTGNLKTGKLKTGKLKTGPEGKWHRVIDTSLPPPQDFLEKPVPVQAPYTLQAHSALLFLRIDRERGEMKK